jgi:hypothetical protein
MVLCVIAGPSGHLTLNRNPLPVADSIRAAVRGAVPDLNVRPAGIVVLESSLAGRDFVAVSRVPIRRDL